MTIDVGQFYQTFFDEAEERLDEMEKLLLAMNVYYPDSEDLNAIFRAAHSLKSGAATFGITDISEITHYLESQLDLIRQGKLTLTTEHVDAFLSAKDVLKMLLNAHKNGAKVSQAVSNEASADVLMIMSSLDHELTGLKKLPAATTGLDNNSPGYGFFEPANPAFALARNPDASEYTANVAETGNEVAAIKEMDNVHVNQEHLTMRVDTEKMNQLVHIIGKLTLTQTMIEQQAALLNPVEHKRLMIGIAQLNNYISDLQKSVTSIRMMSMEYVFSRFPRMVHDLAAKLGKKVELITSGSAIELDRELIEGIVDPLTHLLRNSIDHGIELPEVRRKKGKNEVGKLSVTALQQEKNIVIEVTDDGGGFSREKILAKAKENGLTADNELTDEAVWQFVFEPGFSTADEISDVSGRGVGMDVVKNNITRLGGDVTIRSTGGAGTTILITLPLHHSAMVEDVAESILS